MTAPLMSGKNTRNAFLLMGLFVILYLLVLAVVGMHLPCWHDECHFVETARLFMTSPSIETLIHYNEMSTPLPFMLYAAWGVVFGDSLICLRLLSLMIAAVTFGVFFYFFLVSLSKPRTALLLTIFLALNPYMIGTSIFVYTDMLTMLFLGLLCLATRNRSPVLSFIAAAGGLLCRQYFLFAVIAALCYGFLRFYVQHNRRELRTAGALILSCIPLAVLFICWKGFCPVNVCRSLYFTEKTTFHPHAVTLYTIQLFVYMFPVICFFWKKLYLNRRRLLLATALCWVYWIFPIVVSKPGIAAGKVTVGYFHRFLRIWPGEKLEQAVFFACFTLALPVVFSIIVDTWKRLQSRATDFTLFLNFSIVSFLLVMSFSYMHWEKYFLPLLPIVAIQIVASTATKSK